MRTKPRSLYEDYINAMRTINAREKLLKCEWCEFEASYSINWECGHASACCALCFEESDARDWTMAFNDWTADPAICPNCAG